MIVADGVAHTGLRVGAAPLSAAVSQAGVHCLVVGNIIDKDRCTTDAGTLGVRYPAAEGSILQLLKGHIQILILFRISGRVFVSQCFRGPDLFSDQFLR